MLKHLKNSPFVTISDAHIESRKNFPILEIFITSYIKEAEGLYKYGVKSDYTLKEENISFLKSKLKVDLNLKYNLTNRAKFYCEFSEYSPNIAANRLVKTTLIKLLKITSSHYNFLSINKILTHVEEVEISQSISEDLAQVKSMNRLLSNYKKLIMWSEIFLNNRSFTNFTGDNLNMAILFPMEVVFQDYIAYLFGKYSEGYKIRVQEKKYFLVEKHKENGQFRLKPDIVVDQENRSMEKIVDTKWKLLDQYAQKKNYNITSADMYQLYAYGKKYTHYSTSPSLILLYPNNPNFTEKLNNFIYEGDLILEIIPFDFSFNEEEQIKSIINL